MQIFIKSKFSKKCLPLLPIRVKEDFFHLYNVQHVRNTMDFITTITCDKRLFLRFGFNGQRYE